MRSGFPDDVISCRSEDVGKELWKQTRFAVPVLGDFVSLLAAEGAGAFGVKVDVD